MVPTDGGVVAEVVAKQQGLSGVGPPAARRWMVTDRAPTAGANTTFAAVWPAEVSTVFHGSGRQRNPVETRRSVMFPTSRVRPAPVRRWCPWPRGWAPRWIRRGRSRPPAPSAVRPAGPAGSPTPRATPVGTRPRRRAPAHRGTARPEFLARVNAAATGPASPSRRTYQPPLPQPTSLVNTASRVAGVLCRGGVRRRPAGRSTGCRGRW